MQKVLIITGPLAGHGGEETLLRLVTEQLCKKTRVILVISDLTGNTDWLGSVQRRIRVWQLPHRINRLTKLFRLLIVIYKENADYVIALTPRMLLLAQMVRKISHQTFGLTSWLQFSVTDKFSSFTVRLLRLADEHMVLNDAMGVQISDWGISSKHIHTVLNPIHKQFRSIVPSSHTEPVRFLCLARIQFAGEKNLQELFEGLANLHGEWELHLYGSDDSQNHIEAKKCKRLISRLGIERHIIWHGFVNDVWSRIRTADCLVLTSTFEGFGLVLAEAASLGLPVISSDCPVGPREIVNKENGFLYPSGNTAALHNLLQKFVNRQVRFDSNRVKRSVERFYLDQYMIRFMDVLKLSRKDR